MIVSLFSKDRKTTLELPDKVSGQYWLEEAENGTFSRVIGVEANNRSWYLKANKYTRFSDENATEQKIENNCFYKLKSVRDYSALYVYSEAKTEDRYTFNKYIANSRISINIGRDSNNDISYSNKFVSSRHAILSYDGGEVWSIEDCDSENGVYVNDTRIQGKMDLCSGDVIYIIGLKIIIGGKFIAINNPDNGVTVHCQKLLNMPDQKINDEEIGLSMNNTEKYYFRSPRFQRTVETYKLKVDAPPQKDNQDEMPLAFVIGPSMTMGIASIFTALTSIVNYCSQDPLERNFLTILPTVAMAVGMLAGTVMWPILTKKLEKKKKINKEKERKVKYIKYLNDCREKIQKAIEEQKSILIENYPNIEQIMSDTAFWQNGLWSRQKENDDFMDVRIGNGNIEFDSDISFPEKSFSLDDDDLVDEVQKMALTDYSLNNVPIVHSFYNSKITGLASENRQDTVEFLNNVILQMAMLQSYDELKLVLIGDSRDIENFESLKWIPHFWNDEREFRFIASNFDELKNLSVYLDKIIEKQLNFEDAKELKKEPHYLVIVTNKELALKAEFINKITENENITFSMLFAFSKISDLPKECVSVIEIKGSKATVYDKSDIADTKKQFNTETVTSNVAYDIAKELANIKLDLSSSNYVLPKSLSFLDMFGVGKIEHLNSISRWHDNNPVQSLATPVGVDTQGEQFMIDLHEKYHGPHGLIAGMTGSGKSEFIITFILSLAVNYHPNEVAFILIDYKGGGLTGAFESDDFKLPHLAGTITNLDGSSIKRSLLSIESELRRRQAAFNEARKISGEGTMDIYKYQQLFRNGVVKEPIPHLFIISDEFAELKAQQPEFMDQLISTARIGRSLGVHLILATQKPNGVVDDQIWSNSRFRVCLKVQDKADSMDMIKRADAAEITQTGRFYLQVGFNELFELGQSAYSGADYVPKETEIETKVVNSVSLLDNLGREEYVVKTENNDKKVETNLRQVVEVNKYIYNLAKEENAFSRPLWLEPIPAAIVIDDLKSKYNYSVKNTKGVSVVIGEYDDPTNQKQELLTQEFDEIGNTIIYGNSGSGKEMLIEAYLYSFIKDYDANEVNAYVLDFGAETLTVFKDAPQVNDVILSSDSEKITNLFKLLIKETATRKKLFSNYGGSLTSYIDETNKTLPRIFVIINNYAAFNESYNEYEEVLIQLLREANKCGIYFITTVSNYTDVRYRIFQNFNVHYTLQQNDNSEYSMILGSTGGILPAHYEGRGLVQLNNSIYEFQTARIFKDGNDSALVKECIGKISESATVKAKPVPVLPEKVNSEYLNDFAFDNNELCLGVDCDSLQPFTYNCEKQSVLFISSQDKEDMASYCESMVEIYGQVKNSEIVVFDASGILSKCNAFVTKDEIKSKFDCVYKLLLARHKDFKENKTPEDMHKVFCFIFGVSDLLNTLSAEDKKGLSLMLENVKGNYNFSFVLFDNTMSVSDYSFEKWYKSQTNNTGIWVGDGVVDQYIFNITKRTKDIRKEIENDYGFFINKGKPTLIKLLDESED